MRNELPHFTRKLIELREAAGISQYQLAKLAGLTKQAVSRLELGQQGPAWETVQRLALALNVDCRAFADPSLQLPEQPATPPRRGRPAKDQTAATPKGRKRATAGKGKK